MSPRACLKQRLGHSVQGTDAQLLLLTHPTGCPRGVLVTRPSHSHPHLQPWGCRHQLSLAQSLPLLGALPMSSIGTCLLMLPTDYNLVSDLSACSQGRQDQPQSHFLEDSSIFHGSSCGFLCPSPLCAFAQAVVPAVCPHPGPTQTPDLL